MILSDDLEEAMSKKKTPYTGHQLISTRSTEKNDTSNGNNFQLYRFNTCIQSSYV